VREGDVGDRWYVIADGEVELERNGTLLDTLARGDEFGEIALLHEVRRTGDVKARARCLLYALEKEPFVAAVTGHPLALRAAADLIEARLPALAPID
jgi:CRP-like cAMP-binding protein